MTALRDRLAQLSYGFLVVPGIVALALVALALLMLEAELHVARIGLGFSGDADAARAVLSSIAGSLITVAGLSFSITVVTLQLVSSQYSPRALRGFLTDRLNQLIAGVFVGTFAYCLLVLTTVRNGDAQHAGFVPALAVTVGIVLAVVALALLLVFIHHMSQSIQVARITRGIGEAGLHAVDKLYPAAYGETPAETAEETPSANGGGRADHAVVYARRPGFVRSVDLDGLARRVQATRPRSGRMADRELVIHLELAPGDFATERIPLATIVPASALAEIEDSIHHAVRIGESRDVFQDAAYPVRQLVDIALRGISPSTNDPTTAVDCIGYLRAILERLGGREFPPRTRRFPAADLTIVARAREFDDFVEEAFSELGRYAVGDPRVVLRLLEAIAATADAVARCRAADRLQVLTEVAEGIAAPAIEAARTHHDRRAISEALERVRQAERRPSSQPEAPDEPPGGRESSPGG